MAIARYNPSHTAAGQSIYVRLRYGSEHGIMESWNDKIKFNDCDEYVVVDHLVFLNGNALRFHTLVYWFYGYVIIEST